MWFKEENILNIQIKLLMIIVIMKKLIKTVATINI
jgi:hypothetical protein